MITKLRAIKLISRIALGLVWFYEGLVPKILFLSADEIGLVRAYHLVWRKREFTLQILGVAQMLVGLWLIIGIAERAAGFYRYPLDVDPYRASREWKSVDANRSVRRAGEGLLSHRVYDHRLDTRTNRGELRRS
jgi:DoxX-like family